MWAQRNVTITLALMLLTGCADPAVWSVVAPGYENGVFVSRVAIAVKDIPEPGRSWSEQKLADELSAMGVVPVRNDSRADALLTMRLIGQLYVTINVPLVHHPGETKITTYEKKGETITEIKESPGYTTGGYFYDVPEATAAFTLSRSEPGGHIATVWAANTIVRGAENAVWAALAVDMAGRTARQLKRDKIILPVENLVEPSGIEPLPSTP